MATTVKKDVLWVGSVQKNGKRHDFTQADMEAAAKLGNEKIAAGWTIPLSWDHQPVMPFQSGGLSAEKLAQLTKGTFGRAKAFRALNGSVEAELEIDDPADLKPLKSIQHVSPRVSWDWEDSNGQVWPGISISHIAATARPVVKDQKAFQLSHSVDLSYADFADDEEETPPPQEKAESKADDTPPDDKKDDEDGKPNRFREVLDLLASLEQPIILPDDTTPKNAWERLYVALTAMASTKDGEEDGQVLIEEESPNGALNMSHEKTAAEKKSEQRAVNLTRKDCLSRVKTLLGKGHIAPALADKLKKEINSCDFSFNDAGDPVENRLLICLSAYEELEPKSAWKKTDRRPVDMSLEEVEPADDSADESPKAVAEKVERFGKMLRMSA